MITGLLGVSCSFQGLTPDSQFLPVSKLTEEHQMRFPRGFRGVVPRGNLAGGSTSPYEILGHKALQILKSIFEADPGMGFVIVCDEDGRGPERLQGLQQARDRSALSQRVAVGVACPEVEAWVLAGFHPMDEEETRLHSAEVQRLKLDPTQNPHLLKGPNGSDRDIKRVLGALTDGDHEREAVAASNLPRIRHHGTVTGAVEFLSECEERLAPLFDQNPT
jgi:hypothetical protein